MCEARTSINVQPLVISREFIEEWMSTHPARWSVLQALCLLQDWTRKQYGAAIAYFSVPREWALSLGVQINATIRIDAHGTIVEISSFQDGFSWEKHTLLANY
jgi:hypothetical protein